MNQVLPNTQTLATLDPHTLHVELPYESQLSLGQSMSGKGDGKAFELYAHENQHFQDLIATLWGQDYLDLLFSAYDMMLLTHGSEKCYRTLLSLFDADRAILFPSYYKYVLPPAPTEKLQDRLSMMFTTGARIQLDGCTDESSPILFVRFDKGSVHLARQPVTVGSLLEMRAVGTELGTFTRWNATRPPDEKLVNELLRTREALELLYDPEMTTYSVGSHLAARFLGGSDVLEMTDAGFKLAELALNLTSTEFERLRHPSYFSAMPNQRLRGFKARRDRGYAYAVLLVNLNKSTSGLVNEEQIEGALKLSGFRPISQIFSAAKARLGRKHENQLQHPELKAIRSKLIDAGLTLLGRSNLSTSVLSLAKVNGPSPLVMTGQDLAEFHVGMQTLSRDESTFLHDCYFKLRESTRLALRASRGLDFRWTDYVY